MIKLLYPAFNFTTKGSVIWHPSVTYLVMKNLFHTSPSLDLWWQKDAKDGYGKAEEKIKKMTRTEIIRLGIKELKVEVQKWKEEMKEKFEMDPLLVHRKNETDIIFRFRTSEDLNQWIVTSDSDHNQGHSTSSLSSTQIGTGLFSGELIKKIKTDGKIKNAGYCNISSKRVRKSFKRESYYEWGQYSHIVLKVRGDGRSYMLNLHSAGYYDTLWNDTYQFVLYTRGGPYWQITKIPFSKFFLSSKGRIQDKQYQLSLHRVSSVSITASDRIDGPFQLEIDYIGVEFDPDHKEEFAYEMYKVNNFITAT